MNHLVFVCIVLLKLVFLSNGALSQNIKNRSLIEELPNLAVLEYKPETEKKLIIGTGIIVGIYHVLTYFNNVFDVAQNPSDFLGVKIRAGSDEAFSGGKLFDIEKIIFHNKFDGQNATFLSPYNVALVRVKSPLLCASCRPLDVAPVGQPGTIVQITGFRDKKTASARTINHKIIDPKECEGIIKNKPFIYTGELGDNQVCAFAEEGNGNGPCVTDYGGPVVSERHLVGILISGDPFTCESNSETKSKLPSVFIKADFLQDWINKSMTEDLQCSLNIISAMHKREADLKSVVDKLVGVIHDIGNTCDMPITKYLPKVEKIIKKA